MHTDYEVERKQLLFEYLKKRAKGQKDTGVEFDALVKNLKENTATIRAELNNLVLQQQKLSQNERMDEVKQIIHRLDKNMT